VPIKGMGMNEFIAESEVSKNALKMATLASTLPVQVLIFGEVGVGKKSLARVVAPDAALYDGLELQEMINSSTVNLGEFEILIVSDIDKISNIRQFVEKLEQYHIKLIATATNEKESFSEKFAVRIDLLPLSQRKEDLVILSESYLSEANRHFGTDVKIDVIDMDFSKNSISLRESIYRGVIFDSIDEKQMFTLLEKFLFKQMDEKTEYKELLEIFEIPLINASRAKFKSQLQMAKALNINRNTLRKKINQYNLEDQ
jgi:transcriptional regulator with PAS, ATPase and Fis domain